ncbi:MAG: hypothetical protein P9L93_00130 [Candidatus Gorgyraea atricola]|nr:hypothetical protein [Candidatus Gorgyraea atricola]
MKMFRKTCNFKMALSLISTVFLCLFIFNQEVCSGPISDCSLRIPVTNGRGKQIIDSIQAKKNKKAILEAMSFRTIEEARAYLKSMGANYLIPQWVLPTPSLKLEVGHEFLEQLGISEKEAIDLFSVFSVPEQTIEQNPDLKKKARIAFSFRSSLRAIFFPIKKGVVLDGETFYVIQVRGLGISEQARLDKEYNSNETVRFSERFGPDRIEYGPPLDDRYELGYYTRDAGLARKRTMANREMPNCKKAWDAGFDKYLARNIFLFDVQGYVDSNGQYHTLSSVKKRREYKECAAVVTLHHSTLPRIDEIETALERSKHPDWYDENSALFKRECEIWKATKTMLLKIPYLHEDGDEFGAWIYFPKFVAGLAAEFVNHGMNFSQMTKQNYKLNELADFHHLSNPSEFVQDVIRESGFNANNEESELEKGDIRFAYMYTLDGEELFWPFYIFSGDVSHGFDVIRSWNEALLRCNEFTSKEIYGDIEILYLKTFIDTLDDDLRSCFYFYIMDFCLYIRSKGKSLSEGLPLYLRSTEINWLINNISSYFNMPELKPVNNPHFQEKEAESLRKLFNSKFSALPLRRIQELDALHNSISDQDVKPIEIPAVNQTFL